jgi:hypothetical protein
MNLRTLVLTLIGLAAALAPSIINADTPGGHPAYLRARGNLLSAQFLLRVREEPNVARHRVEAVHEAEAAIGEIDRAAVLDRKDLDDHPRIDLRLERFRKIVELLRTARSSTFTRRLSICTGIANSASACRTLKVGEARK